MMVSIGANDVRRKSHFGSNVGHKIAVQENLMVKLNIDAIHCMLCFNIFSTQIQGESKKSLGV